VLPDPEGRSEGGKLEEEKKVCGSSM